MLGIRKPNFNTKIIPFGKSHNAENCKRGPFEISNIHSVAKYQKFERDPLKTLKKFREKTKNEHFQQSHSAENSEERDPLGLSLFVLLESIKKWREDPLGTLKIFEKSHKAERGESHSAESGNLLLRTLWVEKQASYHYTTNAWTVQVAGWNESCRAEKKHPHFPKTLAYRKCNHFIVLRITFASIIHITFLHYTESVKV